MFSTLLKLQKITILFIILGIIYNLNCLDKKVVKNNYKAKKLQNLPVEIQHLIIEYLCSDSKIYTSNELDKLREQVKDIIIFLNTLSTVNKRLNNLINSITSPENLSILLSHTHNLNALDSIIAINTKKAYEWLNNEIYNNSKLAIEVTQSFYKLFDIIFFGQFDIDENNNISVPKDPSQNCKALTKIIENKCQPILQSCIKLVETDPELKKIAIMCNCLKSAALLTDENLSTSILNDLLMFNIGQKNEETVKLLLKSVPNISFENSNNQTPLLYAIVDKDNSKIAKILIQANLNIDININARDTESNTALMYAVYNNNLKLAELLIKSGADVNVQNFHYATPLTCAIDNNNIELVKILIEFDADVNIRDTNNNTALFGAVYKNNLELYELLIEANININAQNNDGYTALLSAIIVGNLNLINLLIKSGADVNISNNNGFTALMAAVVKNNLDLVKLLVTYGADIYAQSNTNDTALTLSNNPKITDLLKTKSLKIKEKNRSK